MHYLDNTIESLGKIFVNLLSIIYCKSPAGWKQGFSDSQKPCKQNALSTSVFAYLEQFCWKGFLNGHQNVII